MPTAMWCWWLWLAYLLWTSGGLPGVPASLPGRGFVLLVLAQAYRRTGRYRRRGSRGAVFHRLMMISARLGADGWGGLPGGSRPLAFLLFAVPFGHEVLPELMNWTADATVLAPCVPPVFPCSRKAAIS